MPLALFDCPVVCGAPAEEALATVANVDVTTADVAEMLADAVPASTVK